MKNPCRDATMMIQNIFFDLDGTLTDPKIGITKSIQYALEKLGATVPSIDDLEWCIGPPLKESFPQLTGQYDAAHIQQAINFYRERFSTVGKFENIVYDTIPEVLAYLQQAGYRLYVATSKPWPFARDILEHFQLAGYFHHIYGSEFDGRFNDKADLLAHLVETEKLVPGDCLMVGDRRHDIAGAQANAIQSLGVTYGYGKRQELAEAGADYIINTPLEIVQLLDSSSSQESK